MMDVMDELKSGSVNANDNIYKGLYPIREVKQYYKREFLNGKLLYSCLWTDCNFKTWKYLQNIARHIHLKHIGIKKLKCLENNCQKTFKRPESMAQHQKNHLCGFAIDSNKMNDPLNVCGFHYIQKYYFCHLDNDFYVFGCKWTGCEFVTDNLGSIRKHVHNQHLCPYSVVNYDVSNEDESVSSSIDIIEHNDDKVDQSSVEIIELDPTSVMIKMEDTDDNTGDNDNLFATNGKQDNIEADIDAMTRSWTDGLYSMNNYTDLYQKVQMNGEVYYKCNCNQFITKSQIGLVRHIWTDIGRKELDGNLGDCKTKFDNQFSLQKLKESNNNNESKDLRNSGNTNVANNSNGNSILMNTNTKDPKSTYKSGVITEKSSQVNEITLTDTSLETLSHFFNKKLIGNELSYHCKCGHLSTKSGLSLRRHILQDHKGIKIYDCNQCNLYFDSESKLYKHQELDHKLNTNNNIVCNELDSNNSNNLQQNNTINSQTTDELNYKPFYDSITIGSEEWFVCKHEDCNQNFKYKSEMIEHLSGHQFKLKAKIFIPKVILNDNQSIDPILPINVLENQSFVLRTPVIKQEVMDDYNDQTNGEDMSDVDPNIGCRLVDGLGWGLYCKWTDCGYESNQMLDMSKHILDNHFISKQKNPIETNNLENFMFANQSWSQRSPSNDKQQIQNIPPLVEPVLPLGIPSTVSQPWNQFLFANKNQWLEQLSMSSSDPINDHNNDINRSFTDNVDGNGAQKAHLNISSKEDDILLSCKGLASMSKVTQYYDKHVSDGEKYYHCKWIRCDFKTKKSQKIAQHINLSHIGVDFKCNKPNCNKVFRNPNTYREHQKNHICGFGSFGYGSNGVVGVCRNENIFKYRDRVIIDSKKFYRCIWEDCNAISRYYMAMKRHIHCHICPYRVNLKLKHNKQVISKMKNNTWNIDLGSNSMASTPEVVIKREPFELKSDSISS